MAERRGIAVAPHSLASEAALRVLDRLAVDQGQQGSALSRWFPNLFGEIGIFRVTRG